MRRVAQWDAVTRLAEISRPRHEVLSQNTRSTGPTGQRADMDHQHTPEEERQIREAALDETLAESFPASDPPSTLPNPDNDDPQRDQTDIVVEETAQPSPQARRG